jgi:hypothetical protein
VVQSAFHSFNNNVEAELAEAQRLARDPRCAAAVDALNLRIDAAPWGVDWIKISEPFYQPDEAGDGALIMAAEAGGELIDLVACRLSDRVSATRLGVAAVLGAEVIEQMRATGWPLPLFRDPLHWANGGFRGAVVIDWWRAGHELDGVHTIRCPRAIAAAAHRATRGCWPPPRIQIVEKVHQAAA